MPIATNQEIDKILKGFIRRHFENKGRIRSVCEVFEDIICNSMLDYKDQLNSSFIKFQRKFIEGQYNRFLSANRHLIKGYCFVNVPFLMAFDKRHNLQINFKNIFFKLEFYLTNFYLDYFSVVDFVFQHGLCVEFVSKHRFTVLFKVLNQTILNKSFLHRDKSDTIFSTDHVLNTFLSRESSREKSSFTCKLNSYKLFPFVKKG